VILSVNYEKRLERYAVRYLCGSKRVRKRSGFYADFERFLRSRALYILLYTEFGFCPFCKRQFKGYLGLINHLKGGHECGRELRELINQLIEEYVSRKHTKSS
jgi:hypothetical protein